MAKINLGRIKKKIVPISQAEPYLRALIYGPNKNGKTALGATAPHPLILDINEKGTKTARRTKGAYVLPCESWTDVVEGFWYLRQADHGFESFIIDTATAMQAVCMKHVLKEAHVRDPNKDPKLPSKRDYGKVTELMRGQILAFRNLPMHGIFLAQERITGDPDEGEPLMHEPDLSAGNRGSLMGAVDLIGRVYLRERFTTVKVRGKKREKRSVEQRMLLGYHDEYRTGNRDFGLPPIIRNPTIPVLIEAAIAIAEEGEE
jgi:hypothetical protein